MAIYLVTGGCGFIGSHLSEALIGRGHVVRILDDLSSGSLENAPRGAEVVHGSVADPQIVDAMMESVAGCFHLAAVASVERSMHDWFGSNRTNLSGTIAVFDAVRRMAQGRRVPVIYASSAAIYGNPEQLPISETTPAQPSSPYGIDKYACELHARVASKVYRIPTVGLRFFNVYGPRQDPRSPYSGVISIFCERLLRREPIDVFGDGTQTRDFVFIADVVLALLAAMDRAEECSIVFSGVYNVCTGAWTSVIDLARLLGAICDWEPEIRFRSPRSGDIANSWGDPQLVRRHLNLTDPVKLRLGLTSTLGWMKNGFN